jgi:transcriptional regulator with XRE-family HTH domain
MELETVKITQLELAEALGVTQPTLSEATAKGYYCAGRPVSEWAHTDEKGRVEHYEAPASLVNEEQDDEEEPVGEYSLTSPSEESLENNYSVGKEEVTENDEEIGWKEGFGTLALAMGVKVTLEK